jgi:hypothetical protein
MTIRDVCRKLVVICRSLPFISVVAFAISMITWYIAHRKVDVVVDGLYTEWHGADETKSKIQMLDLPFAGINALNFVAMLMSFSVVKGKCQTTATGLLKTRTATCLPTLLWVSVFGIVAFLLLISTGFALIMSHLLLILWLILHVLSVFCALPPGLLPMADNIIDNLDHPLTAGLDLIKFCPEHSHVDLDAYEMLAASFYLTLSQAVMLACITSSAELVNFDLFHIMDPEETTDTSDQDPDDPKDSLVVSERSFHLNDYIRGND